MLCVSYGSFSQLESAFIERLQQAKAADPLARLAVVTPSRHMADRLERLVALEQGLSLLNVHFHTFYSLAAGVLEDQGFPDRFLVRDPVFHDRLIDALLSSQPGLGKRFGGASRPKALASALRASIRDLIDAGVEPEQVLDHIGDDWPEGPEACERLKDILDLQAAYEDWLREHQVLSTSKMTASAARAVEGSRFLEGFQEILYYGFYDLTGLQLEFFENVTGSRPSTLFFPYLKGHPAFRFCDEFFELKLHRGAAPPQALAAPDASALAPAMSALFSGLRSCEVPKGVLRVFNASGARDEVWRVSKEILRLNAEEAVSFDDMGVVARTLEPYRAAVAEVFGADAVPFEMRENEPLQRHPLAKMAMELLLLKRRDFPCTAVSDLVQSPYFRASARGRTASSWPRLIESLGVCAGWLVWEAKLERACKSDLKGSSPADARALLDLLISLKKDLEPGTMRRPWNEWAAYARKLLAAYLSVPEDASRAEDSVWESLWGAVDSLAAFDLLGDTDWDFFLETLVEKLEAAGLEGPSRRGVRVLNAMDARGESFRFLFFLGLQEGMFPRQVREDPVLRDAARSRLKHPGGYWIARKTSGHEEERLLFYLCVAAARERLYCVYSRSDEDGKARTPSWYLRELCRAAGVDLQASAEHVARQPLARLSNAAPESLHPQELALRLVAHGEDACDYLDGAVQSGALLRRVLPRIRLLNAGGKAGPMDGVIGEQKGFLERLRKRGLSPSGLDMFGRCPFQYFSSYVLELEEGEELADRGEFSSTLRGTVYHAVLERFYKHLSESGYWASPYPWEPELSRIMDAVFSEHGWKEVGVYPLVWKAARSAMEERLRGFVRWDMERIRSTGLIPGLFEKELRGPLPLPNFSKAAPGHGIEFNGRADRIDLDGAGKRFQVVDYKTRWARRKRPDQLVLSGEMHQPPVYASLAGALLGKPWTLEGAPVYTIEPREDVEPSYAHEYPASLWDQDRKTVMQGIAAYVREIEEGRFPIKPEDGEHGYCSWCCFSGICRKSHSRSRTRAQNQYEGSVIERIHERKRPRA